MVWSRMFLKKLLLQVLCVHCLNNVDQKRAAFETGAQVAWEVALGTRSSHVGRSDLETAKRFAAGTPVLGRRLP